MPTEEPYRQFVQLLEAFVAGQNRTREGVAAIENEFAKHFDQDDRFADLRYELAMYGSDDHPGDGSLVKECEWALKLLHADRRQVDFASHSHRGVPLLRDTAALTLVAISFIWSGQVIQGAGFGGWLVALFLGVVLPLVVCLVASRWPVLFGLMAATSLAVSALLHNPKFRPGGFAGDPWEDFWQRDAGVWFFIWGFLAVLSLVVSVPLALWRRRITGRWSGPEPRV